MNQPWSCYLDAVVRLTKVHEGQLISLIGHDGSEIVNDSEPPFCYRGFNAHLVGMALTQLGWLAATYPSVVEEGHTAVSLTNLRNHLISLGQPVIYCGNDHAVGYLPEELATLPVQNPIWFTILTPLPK